MLKRLEGLKNPLYLLRKISNILERIKMKRRKSPSFDFKKVIGYVVLAILSILTGFGINVAITPTEDGKMKLETSFTIELI